jgi:hypothetical protein
MLLPSYLFSSDAPLSAEAPSDARTLGRGRARQLAVRERGLVQAPIYQDVMRRLVHGGVRPAYTPAFPPLVSPTAEDEEEEGKGEQQPQQCRLRTVEDYVGWLASPERPPGIDPAQGKLSAARALRKRQQVVGVRFGGWICG